ncbi:MAG: M28 family peptidase [Salibacteraceae bacterium]
MKNNLLLLWIMLLMLPCAAQQNMSLTNPTADAILFGNYNPQDYASSSNMDDPREIAAELTNRINPDSLHSYLKQMRAFETRHTSSDTLSLTRGMGAARKWAYEKFQKFSQQHEDRLEVSYLEFDRNICGVNRHKNILAVLPGKQLEDEGLNQSGIIIIEGHLDSRCDDVCDTNCVAEGMEDNGSGSALVMELTRVLAKYEFNRTIVFMLTTAEEQGLFGANAMAQYCKQNKIPVAAVLNNDVIGGVICGETSSPPSCPSENHIDSTQVRLFSSGTFNSPSKQLARYIKLQYHEELIEHVAVSQMLTIMTAEDRTGRGGDHIPFRQAGFAAMRFTSANEHGDASNGSEYDDRQHTSDDVLGVDTDNDGQLDSFFVDFNYLARNAAINANAAAFIGQNICNELTVDLRQENWHQLRVKTEGEQCAEPPYRIAVRSETNDWDTLINTDERETIIEIPIGMNYFISACRVDEDGVESLFSGEYFISISGSEEPKAEKPIALLQNRPNPFDESTAISFVVNEMPADREAEIRITDVNGRTIHKMHSTISHGINEILYDHGYGKVGTYFYSLVIDDRVIDTKKMVFVAY